MTQHQNVIAAVAMLYMLPEKWRGIGNSGSFERLLWQDSPVSLHRALAELHQEGLLGNVYEYFEFDPLYGTSNLGMILAEASYDMLVRVGGLPLRYHLDELDEHVLCRILKSAQIDEGSVRCASQRLLELLEEQTDQGSEDNDEEVRRVHTTVSSREPPHDRGLPARELGGLRG